MTRQWPDARAYHAQHRWWPLHVVMPTLGDTPRARAAISRLESEDFDAGTIVDTGPPEAAWPGLPDRWHVIRDPRPGVNISRWWNLAWQAAPSGWHTLFLNDDVHLTTGTLTVLRNLLVSRATIVSPDPTSPRLDWPPKVTVNATWRVEPVHGTKRAGGVDGAVFAVSQGVLDHVGPFDEQFEWWCGDDDMVHRVDQAAPGRVTVVRGLGYDHDNEATARHLPELHQVKADDITRYQAKWPGRW